MRFHKAGVCDFPRDPNIAADRESLFWLPKSYPKAVLLKTEQEPLHPTSIALDLSRLPGLDLRRADDGWHGFYRVGSSSLQFWLEDFTPEVSAYVTAFVPFDAFSDLREHAGRQLRRVLSGLSPGADLRVMPRQLRQLHVLTLRVLDARLAGESYRTIAHELLGFNGDKADWESDPRKNKVRRVAASGMRWMLGGYRALLHYPIKLYRD